jgi:hypothetical protein
MKYTGGYRWGGWGFVGVFILKKKKKKKKKKKIDKLYITLQNIKYNHTWVHTLYNIDDMITIKRRCGVRRWRESADRLARGVLGDVEMDVKNVLAKIDGVDAATAQTLKEMYPDKIGYEQKIKVMLFCCGLGDNEPGTNIGAWPV